MKWKATCVLRGREFWILAASRKNKACVGRRGWLLKFGNSGAGGQAGSEVSLSSVGCRVCTWGPFGPIDLVDFIHGSKFKTTGNRYFLFFLLQSMMTMTPDAPYLASR
jgi:hypothetical protein